MKKRPNSVPPINIMRDDLSQATHLVSAASLALGDIDHYARNAVSAVLEIVEEKLEDIERRLEILNRALAPDHSVASDVQRLQLRTSPMLVDRSPNAAQAPALAKEKAEFAVALIAIDENKKTEAIKAVREITGLGLKETKEIVEDVLLHSKPLFVETHKTKEDAEKIKATLEKVGAKAELKRTGLR